MVLIKYRIFVHSIESYSWCIGSMFEYSWISALFLMSMTTLHGTIYPTLLGENNKIPHSIYQYQWFHSCGCGYSKYFHSKNDFGYWCRAHHLISNQKHPNTSTSVHKKIKVQGADLKSEIIASVSQTAPCCPSSTLPPCAPILFSLRINPLTSLNA